MAWKKTQEGGVWGGGRVKIRVSKTGRGGEKAKGQQGAKQ